MDAYDRAIKLLAVREHTEKEIRRKLKERGASSDEIDEAVDKLLEEGSLSERRFAESYIRSRLRKNPEGRSILKMRLLDKGTPRSVADEALEEVWESGGYIKPLSEYAEILLRKKGEEGTRATLLRKGWRESEIREAFSLLDSSLSE